MVDTGWLAAALVVESAKVAVLLAAAAALGLLLRRSRPAIRSSVWSLALVGALLVPVLSPLIPSSLRASVAFLERRPPPARVLLLPPLSVEAAPMATPAVELPAAPGQPAAAPAPRPATVSFASALLAIWSTGTALLLLRLALGLARLRRLERGARPAADGEWQPLLHRATKGIGIRRPVRLLVGDRAGVPRTWGLLAPRILLPAASERWTGERRTVVLLHELAHVRRGDWALRLLARVLVALHWPNPLAWLALRRLEIEQETACDEAVLEAGTRPSSYAEHLLDIARSTPHPHFEPLGALSMARASQMETRLMSILDPRRSLRRPARTLPILLFLAGLVPLLAAVEPWSPAPPAEPASGEPAAEPRPLSEILDDLQGIETKLAPEEEALRKLEGRLRPFQERLATAQEELSTVEEPAREQLATQEEALRRIEAEMAPYEAQLRELEEELEPHRRRLADLEARMRPVERRLEASGRELAVELEVRRRDEVARQRALAREQAEIEAGIAEPERGERLAELREREEALRDRFEAQQRDFEAAQEGLVPIQEEMTAVQREMAETLRRSAEIHRDMVPLQERIAEVHRAAEPAQVRIEAQQRALEPQLREMESIHAQMAPVFAEMEGVRRRMEGVHRELEGLHRELESAVRREVGALLSRHLGPVCALETPFDELSSRLLEVVSLQLRDGRIYLRSSSSELRTVLGAAAGPYRKASEADFDRAVEAATDALASIELPR